MCSISRQRDKETSRQTGRQTDKQRERRREGGRISVTDWMPRRFYPVTHLQQVCASTTTEFQGRDILPSLLFDKAKIMNGFPSKSGFSGCVNMLITLSNELLNLLHKQPCKFHVLFLCFVNCSLICFFHVWVSIFSSPVSHISVWRPCLTSST